MEEFNESPWYRQFWPWFVMALPAAAVAASFVTLYLAGSEPAMVVDDYGQIAKVTKPPGGARPSVPPSSG